MSDVVVTRQDGPLARETWRYWYNDRTRTLVLDGYARESLPSTRHRNWVTNAGWERLGHRRMRNRLPMPPARGDVDAEALAIFRASIRVAPVPQ